MEINDKVYVITAYSIETAIIIDIIHTQKGDMAMLRGIDDSIGSFGALLKNCFATKEEAILTSKNRSEKLIYDYKEQIKTVEDLVRFAYDNCIASVEEYTDWEARTAYAERANELLQLKLNIQPTENFNAQ